MRGDLGARGKESRRPAGHFPWLLTVIVCLASACRPTRPAPDPRLPIELGLVDEWVYATHPQLPLDAAAMRAIAQGVLNETSDFQAISEPVGEAPARGGLLVRVEDVVVGEAYEVSVLVRLTLPSGTRWQGRGSGSGAPEQAARAAVKEGLEEARWESKAAHLPDSELLATLHDPSSRRRSVALRRLSARRHPAVFAPLIDALSADCRAEDASSALSGLAALGDPRAAPSVIDAMERCEEPTFQLQAAFALGSLGGDMAEAYLFTLSAGHADPRMRQAAREAHTLLLRQAPRDGGAGDVP